MSGLQQLRGRLKNFLEIRDILESLKTLAQIEMQKLTHHHERQVRVLESRREPLRDLLSFHPKLWPELPDECENVLLLLGSERGFCGDFNASLERLAKDWSGPLVVVGSKLKERFPNRDNTIFLVGPLAAEEVKDCQFQLLETLNGFGTVRPLRLTVILHDDADRAQPTPKLVWPIQEEPPEPEYAYPPDHNLSVGALLSRLLEHYFSAVLQQLLYSSLLAENKRRIRHLEGAVQHLDQNVENLKRRRNKLRQEEITNEIEILLMGAEFQVSD